MWMRVAADHYHDPDVLRIRKEDGCLGYLFGMPFLLGGAIALFCLIVGWAHDENGQPATWWVYLIAVPLLLLFTGIGAMLALVQESFTLDRRLGTIVCWWSFLWWRRQEENDLESFDALLLVRYPNPAGESKDYQPWAYCIKLRPRNSSGKAILLGDEMAECRARSNLDKLVNFLRLPVVEETTESMS